MKYILALAFSVLEINVCLERTPFNTNGNIIISDTMVPKPTDSLPYWVFNKRVSERVIDSLINEALKEVMLEIKLRKHMDTIKK